MHGDVVHGDYYWWLKQRVPDADALRGPENAIPEERYVLPQAYRNRVPEELTRHAILKSERLLISIM